MIAGNNGGIHVNRGMTSAPAIRSKRGRSYPRGRAESKKNGDGGEKEGAGAGFDSPPGRGRRAVRRRNPPGPRNLPAPRTDKAGGSAKLGAKGGKGDAVGQETEDLGVLTGVVLPEGHELVLHSVVFLVRVQ